eukprot:gnl/Spiro4/9446_TR5002_c0_g1_i1.p1 gnl/Spiro4/9446_TR5002_c0_g1~~gnl/Spiro4/9446_TR5002_c0_g1_i1.p1  ORF type:complete len:297 (-),score=48.61 gnl/Spiro4/9446_TR5002_c0_g1_i1:63-926(-)
MAALSGALLFLFLCVVCVCSRSADFQGRYTQGPHTRILVTSPTDPENLPGFAASQVSFAVPKHKRKPAVGGCTTTSRLRWMCLQFTTVNEKEKSTCSAKLSAIRSSGCRNDAAVDVAGCYKSCALLKAFLSDSIKSRQPATPCDRLDNLRKLCNKKSLYRDVTGLEPSDQAQQVEEDVGFVADDRAREPLPYGEYEPGRTGTGRLYRGDDYQQRQREQMYGYSYSLKGKEIQGRGPHYDPTTRSYDGSHPQYNFHVGGESTHRSQPQSDSGGGGGGGSGSGSDSSSE